MLLLQQRQCLIFIKKSMPAQLWLCDASKTHRTPDAACLAPQPAPVPLASAAHLNCGRPDAVTTSLDTRPLLPLGRWDAGRSRAACARACAAIPGALVCSLLSGCAGSERAEEASDGGAQRQAASDRRFLLASC